MGSTGSFFGVEETVHLAIERRLTTYSFIVFLVFGLFVLYCFTSAVSSTPSKSRRTRYFLKINFSHWSKPRGFAMGSTHCEARLRSRLWKKPCENELFLDECWRIRWFRMSLWSALKLAWKAKAFVHYSFVFPQGISSYDPGYRDGFFLVFIWEISSRLPSSSRKLVILFVVIAAAVIVLELGGFVSVVRSIVLAKGFKPFMWDVTRAETCRSREAREWNECQPEIQISYCPRRVLSQRPKPEEASL